MQRALVSVQIIQNLTDEIIYGTEKLAKIKMARKRRSIVSETHRSSEEILNDALAEESGAMSAPQVREWQRAVVEELKTLDENQAEESEKISDLSNKTETLETLITSSQAAYRGEIEDLKSQLKLVSQDNDRLLEKNANLSIEIGNMSQKFKTCISMLERKFKEEINCLKSSKSIAKDRVTANQGDASSKLKMTLPKFKGHENERPMKFLSELRKYISILNPENTELLYVISQSLDEAARDWWYLQEDDVENWEDFEST